MTNLLTKVVISVVVSVVITKALNARNKRLGNGVVSTFTFIKL